MWWWKYTFKKCSLVLNSQCDIRISKFILKKRETGIFLQKVITTVLLQLRILRSAAHKPYIKSLSNCSWVQSSYYFTTIKFYVTAERWHLEWLIPLHVSSIDILKSKGPKTQPCRTPKCIPKWHQKFWQDVCQWGIYKTS
jgi:hypothetical protein